MAPDTLEALGEAADDVEYQRTVADRFSKVSEGVGHVLEAAAVLRDGQVPLTEVAELGVEVEGASLLIPEELILEGKAKRREPWHPERGQTPPSRRRWCRRSNT
jgi:hypothetical protein